MEQRQERLVIGTVGKDSKFRKAVEKLYFEVFTGYPWYDDIELEDATRICERYFEENSFTVLGGIKENDLVSFSVIKEIGYDEIPISMGKFNTYNLDGLYIEELGVKPEYQKQGLGGEMMEYVMGKYLNRFFYFTTNNSSDSPMRKLTQSLGFEFVTDEDNNIKVFSQDPEKGSLTERCSLFYNNVRNKQEQEKKECKEGERE